MRAYFLVLPETCTRAVNRAYLGANPRGIESKHKCADFASRIEFAAFYPQDIVACQILCCSSVVYVGFCETTCCEEVSVAIYIPYPITT